MKIKNSLFVLLAIFALAINAAAADGDLDASFNGNGRVSTDLGGTTETAWEVLAQPDGKIVVIGTTNFQTTNRVALVRYNADGSLDTTFGTGGRSILGSSFDGVNTFGAPYSAALQVDGKFIIGSRSAGSFPQIIRINADGSLDTTFGTGGYVRVRTNGNAEMSGIEEVIVQPDGKILLGGNGYTNTPFAFGFTVAKLNANGSFDTAFGTGGISVNSFDTGVVANNALAMALSASGKIAVSGFRFNTGSETGFLTLTRVAVFNADGSPDAAFGTGGKVSLQTNDERRPNAVAFQTDEKIVIGGTTDDRGTEAIRGFLQRFTTGGAADATFGTNGLAIVKVNNRRTEFNDIAIQTDGKILGFGYAVDLPSLIGGFGVVRHTTNGTPDTSFGTNGFRTFLWRDNPAVGADAVAYSGILQPDGKILAAGQDNTQVSGLGQRNFGVARYLNSGSNPPVNNPALRIADFDGDGKTDASVFRNGNWFINPSSNPSSLAPNAFYGVQWGISTDKLASADFDGDGKTDVAIWRESERNFYILNSSNNSVRVENFGLVGDVLTVGDYDGDGKADLSTYREGSQSYFFYRGSLNNPSGNITYIPWGSSGDKVVRGDFDGDAKLDVAVYRGSNQTWYIRNSSNGQTKYATFGLSTDKKVSGDFDGDGKTDITVFRDGVWYILQSSNNQIRYQNWGLSSDTLAAGDYDGDGKTDVAIWRNGIYYVLNSGNSSINYQYFGSSGDKVVASAFIQ